MCQLITEGTMRGCGHYQITRNVDKIDCKSHKCVFSERHRRPCPDCTNCQKFMGPDLEERITQRSSQWCDHCSQWYKGKVPRT